MNNNNIEQMIDAVMAMNTELTRNEAEALLKEELREKSLQEAIDNIKIRDINPENIMKAFKVMGEFYDESEMIESMLYNDIFKGFQNSDKARRLRNPSKSFHAYQLKPISLETEELSTETNIYEWNTCDDDNLSTFNKVELHSMLSNAPFQRVVFSYGYVFFIERNWDKSNKNRRILAENRILVTVV